jgi:carboxylesterase type B
MWLTLVGTINSVLASANIDVIINTTEGEVQGDVANGCRVYYNIPYASPPIGTLRFAPPESPKQYNESLLDASVPSPISCMQPPLFNPGGNSEDCLYLNIYAPLNASSSTLLPVLVWIHGGGFFLGGKDQYNLTRFASTGAVVGVSINYRLGPFGFLRVDEESPGVNGFLDQVQALKWIRANIANFGGDPDKVTIAGESAGGSSVLLHLISPASNGLFHQAYASSPWSSIAPTMIDANVTSATFAMVANCSSDDLRSCIQNATAEFIMEKYGAYQQLCSSQGIPYYAYHDEQLFLFCSSSYPVVGNAVLPGQIKDFLNKTANKVSSVMIGATWNDALWLPGGFGGKSLQLSTPDLYKSNQINRTQGNYIHVLNQVVDRKPYDEDADSYTRLYSSRAQAIYEMYPYEINEDFTDMYPYGYNGYQPDGSLDATYVYMALAQDKYWLCPPMSAMSIMLKNSPPSSVYMFRFKQPLQVFQSEYAKLGNDPVRAVEKLFYSLNLYPSHAFDMPFFSLTETFEYPLILTATPVNFTADEEKLNLRMFSAFVDFLHTGDPNLGPMNASVGTTWEKYDPDKRNMIYLSEPEVSVHSAENVRASQCKFWEEDMNFEF